jgi:hypothetical protein
VSPQEEHLSVSVMLQVLSQLECATELLDETAALNPRCQRAGDCQV